MHVMNQFFKDYYKVYMIEIKDKIQFLRHNKAFILTISDHSYKKLLWLRTSLIQRLHSKGHGPH